MVERPRVLLINSPIVTRAGGERHILRRGLLICAEVDIVKPGGLSMLARLLIVRIRCWRDLALFHLYSGYNELKQKLD